LDEDEDVEDDQAGEGDHEHDDQVYPVNVYLKNRKRELHMTMSCR
jgi:hypothetical protein